MANYKEEISGIKRDFWLNQLDSVLVEGRPWISDIIWGMVEDEEPMRRIEGDLLWRMRDSC